MVSNKMVEGVSFARQPVPLESSTGNSAHSWGKWKQKCDIYLRAIGAAKILKKGEVGLLIKHIDEPCLEIYSNFIFLPKRDDPAGGEGKLPAENPDNYATIMAKFDEHFQERGDHQLMVRNTNP